MLLSGYFATHPNAPTITGMSSSFGGTIILRFLNHNHCDYHHYHFNHHYFYNRNAIAILSRLTLRQLYHWPMDSCLDSRQVEKRPVRISLCHNSIHLAALFLANLVSHTHTNPTRLNKRIVFQVKPGRRTCYLCQVNQYFLPHGRPSAT